MKKPQKNSNKELTFTCPDCGEHKLGSVEQVIMTYPITRIPKDGDLDYDTVNPTNGDSQVLSYQCMNCGYELKDKNGNAVADCVDVPVWIKANMPKK